MLCVRACVYAHTEGCFKRILYKNLQNENQNLDFEDEVI